MAKKERKVSKKFSIKKGWLLVALAIILLVLAYIALMQLGLLSNPFGQVIAKREVFSIQDSCSVIVGNLIHPIPSEDACRIRCRAECEVRGKQFDSVEFTARQGDCNDCSCSCQ